MKHFWKMARPAILRSLLASAVAVGTWPGSGAAADPRTDATNKGIVELETGSSSGISVRIAEDLAGLVDDGATRRVLPVVGRTAAQNVWDLVLLRGVDMAILQTDVLDSIRQQRTFPGIESAFSYVTVLYHEEFHLLARADVKTVSDLAQRRVSVGIRGSGSSVTAERLFGLLKVPAELVYDRPEAALEKLRHGDVEAVAFVSGKPASLFMTIRPDDSLHLLPIPQSPAILDAYVPTTLDSKDYPALIPDDQQVDTVAVGSVLAVAKLPPGTERYKNVVNFVDVFFTEFRSLLEPGHHPKWREVNLAADFPGWSRFPPAQQWLDRNAAVAYQSPQQTLSLFSRFLDARQHVLGSPSMSEQQKQELFDQFQRWRAGSNH
jgi:TRAP-type uncharacterized transport system substrate-binding protein